MTKVANLRLNACWVTTNMDKIEINKIIPCVDYNYRCKTLDTKGL